MRYANLKCPERIHLAFKCIRPEHFQVTKLLTWASTIFVITIQSWDMPTWNALSVYINVLQAFKCIRPEHLFDEKNPICDCVWLNQMPWADQITGIFTNVCIYFWQARIQDFSQLGTKLFFAGIRNKIQEKRYKTHIVKKNRAKRD